MIIKVIPRAIPELYFEIEWFRLNTIEIDFILLCRESYYDLLIHHSPDETSFAWLGFAYYAYL
jgi:hypothetical protein